MGGLGKALLIGAGSAIAGIGAYAVYSKATKKKKKKVKTSSGKTREIDCDVLVDPSGNELPGQTFDENGRCVNESEVMSRAANSGQIPAGSQQPQAYGANYQGPPRGQQPYGQGYSAPQPYGQPGFGQPQPYGQPGFGQPQPYGAPGSPYGAPAPQGYGAPGGYGAPPQGYGAPWLRCSSSQHGRLSPHGRPWLSSQSLWRILSFFFFDLLFSTLSLPLDGSL